MAEGFLEPSSNIGGNERSMVEIGEEYFDSLLWSSFLDGVKKNELDDIVTCKMHDLVHDLGRDVVGSRECASANISELENNSDIRRLQFISDDGLSGRCFKALSELKKLRTLMALEPSNNMIGYKFSSNKKLRVLYFGRSAKGCPEVTYPAASKLRHLRYFHISGLKLISMHDDESITKLYNLQTLVLSGCASVHNVLKNMGSLKNLRFLDISSSDIKKLPDSVTSLCNLQRLDLSHCKSLTTFPNSVTCLKYLKFLVMCFTPIEELPGFIINLANLQTLDVNGCEKLKSLPKNVAGLSNLRIFEFKNCPLVEALPEDFGAFCQLRSLDLEGTGIKVLPDSCSNLHNLEVLHLCHCELPRDVKNFTKLKKFRYTYREKTIMPEGVGKLALLQGLIYAVHDKLINEAECNVGVEELGNLNFLEALDIVNLENVKDPIDAERANLKVKQNLRELGLCWGKREEELSAMWWDENACNDLQLLKALQPPPGLIILGITNFMGSDLPTWICPSGLPELAYLRFVNCRGMKQLPASIGKLPRIKYLKLTGISLKS
ncbi:disease resistance protein RGA2-like [Papaver somniferum]|uniref:disease resistance protein RGA2-like n=1 Tax=Papaver somniferum TaxID=3469 RepID=UPI000E6F8213|nr:disease resistance protein RGA2-like [Papaver somniferum]